MHDGKNEWNYNLQRLLSIVIVYILDRKNTELNPLYVLNPIVIFVLVCMYSYKYYIVHAAITIEVTYTKVTLFDPICLGL